MPEMERADQSWLVLKNWGPNIKNCHTSKVLKPKNSHTILVYENLHEIGAGQASIPVPCEQKPFILPQGYERPLFTGYDTGSMQNYCTPLNFLLLQTLLVPQFSV